MAAVTIFSDVGAPQNKVSHFFSPSIRHEVYLACSLPHSMSKVIKEPLKRKTESVWKGDDNEVLLNTTLRVQLTLR